MSETIITIQPDQYSIDKSWDDLVNLDLLVALYHTLHRKGMITTDEVHATADRALSKVTADITNAFEESIDERDRHLARIISHIARFKDGFKD